jgi:hypothetical protein
MFRALLTAALSDLGGCFLARQPLNSTLDPTIYSTLYGRSGRSLLLGNGRNIPFDGLSECNPTGMVLIQDYMNDSPACYSQLGCRGLAILF